MLDLYLRSLARYIEMRSEFRLSDRYDAVDSFVEFADWIREYALIDLTPIASGRRAALPYEWWLDGRRANDEPSVNNWMLLAADSLAYAHRLTGKASYLEAAARFFRTGTHDPWFEGDANTYSATKETVNGITWGHTFLGEWRAAARK
jgi:hypothetical protein